MLLAIAWSAGEFAERRARAELAIQAKVAADLHAAVLRAELEKHRSLPFVLAEDPDVRAMLLAGAPADQVRRMNQRLEDLSDRTRAAVLYVIGRDGRTVAASNWRLPTSFVGSDYGFRPYFARALARGASEYFALGTVSGRPGLFLARRIDGAGGPLGVVVVKVEFDALEAEWRRSVDLAYVTDADGVVLVTSVPEWRFRTQAPLTPDVRRRLRSELQFGASPLAPLPLRAATPDGLEQFARPPGATGEQKFVRAEAETVAPGWRLHLLTPADPVTATAVTAARAVALIAGGLVIVALGLFIRRRELEVSRAAAREQARIELETRVQDRTAELRSANERLVVEMEERRRAEATLHTMQDELVQATKLAMLGQIAAGVAHEINQPVAAIRTYADNAVTFIDRSQADPARANLSIIASLTERIGLITDELRAFARKTSGQPKPVPVGEAVAGALLLVGPAIRREGVKLVESGDMGGLEVQAERIRLEQVLVNLLQNALEAVSDVKGATVRLGVEATADEVRIRVSDNGPGLDEAVRQALFRPFTTTKDKGLGLGLVISRDIMREFGGRLEFDETPGAGATFVVVLKRA